MLGSPLNRSESLQWTIVVDCDIERESWDVRHNQATYPETYRNWLSGESPLSQESDDAMWEASALIELELG